MKDKNLEFPKLKKNICKKINKSNRLFFQAKKIIKYIRNTKNNTFSRKEIRNIFNFKRSRINKILFILEGNNKLLIK